MAAAGHGCALVAGTALGGDDHVAADGQTLVTQLCQRDGTTIMVEDFPGC